MSNGNSKRLVLVAACALVAPLQAKSDYFTPDDFGMTAQASSDAVGQSFSYDADTDLFSYFGIFGREGENLGVIYERIAGEIVRPPRVTDVFGTFSLTAIVDSAGITHGGEFSLIGESTQLGVSGPTVLMQGNVVAVEFFSFVMAPDGSVAGPLFQPLVDITFVVPELTAVFGSVRSAIVNCLRCGPSPAFSADPWSVSFGPVPPSTFNPNIWMSPNRVPEPSTFFLLAIGFLALLRNRGQFAPLPPAH